MLPKKIFMGFDAGGKRGVEYTGVLDRYFTLVAVSTKNFQVAQSVANWLESKWQHETDKHPHSHWEEISLRLVREDLQFYIFYVDKEIFKGKIDKSNYNKMKFSRVKYAENGVSKYTVINDEYAKHGWLAIEELIIQQYKGPTEIRWDTDLEGYGWETSKDKVKEHAQKHLGSCDLQDAGMEYPLIRIADIVASFTNSQLEKGMQENGEPPIVNRLRPKVCKMWLDISKGFRMESEEGKGFKAW